MTRAALVQLGRRNPSDVAEPLDDAALVGEIQAHPLAGLLGAHDDAGAGRLAAEDGAPDRDGLPRHNLGDGVPDLRRVGVHHPRHRLFVRRHVGRRNVLLRADGREQLGRETPCEPLELVLRQRVRVAADAALRAAVREAKQRALPRHPRRERRALAERHLRVIAHAALRWSEHGGVLHAVAGEDLPPAVVAAERDAHDQGALGEAQALGHHRRDVGVRQRLLELRAGHEKERRVPLERPFERRCLQACHARSVVRCRGRDSNPHARRHPILSRARLTSSATPAPGA